MKPLAAWVCPQSKSFASNSSGQEGRIAASGSFATPEKWAAQQIFLPEKDSCRGDAEVELALGGGGSRL
jgi:hypothetical protein